MIEPNPEKGFRVFLWMIAVLVIPAFLALQSVKIPGELVFLHHTNSICDSYSMYEGCEHTFSINPTPHGYTWSLSLFIIPCLTIWTWLHFSFKNKVIEKALRL